MKEVNKGLNKRRAASQSWIGGFSIVKGCEILVKKRKDELSLSSVDESQNLKTVMLRGKRKATGYIQPDTAWTYNVQKENLMIKRVKDKEQI